MNKSNTLNYIKTKNFVASKKLGQNFLVNENIKDKIVSSANLENVDLVIEIGPGLGSITRKILQNTNKNLLAIELDKRLFANLKEEFKGNKRFSIINDDFLNIKLDELISQYSNKKVVVIANLPYSISSLIIAKLCLSKKINEAIIMVQKEMAQRICANPNSNGYNAFSAWLKLSTKIEFLFDVGPKNFIPIPKVMSTVVRIKINNIYNDEELEEYKKFFIICFQAKRKTLINNLINFYDKKDVKEIFERLNIDLNVRAEKLSHETLIKIYNNLKSIKYKE